MFDLPLSSRLRFIGGVRYETTDLSTISQDSTVERGELEEQDLLPSVNLIYALKSNMNIRAAFTKTLARPTFREIAPFESFAFINSEFLIGNPDLERTLIDNFDLRWEWFMSPGEIIAISGFYKRLTNPIERTILNTNNQVQYKNVDNADVYGLEFEVRKQLGDSSSPFRHFNVGANFTIVESKVDIATSELEIRRAVDESADDTRSLQGQSPFLLNLDVTYSNSESKTTLSLSFNTFGDRLSSVSIGGTPDVLERRRNQLNFNASQAIFNFLTLKFGVKNILNDSYTESYEFKGDEFIYQEYKLGRVYSFGASYSL
ncbi:TonB-dependent receptor [candidate division KSB1 bacterium]|nr:TonB-dependent receptor [candidate division KSB1 bacterium]NIR70831.1 TonB-dependent receptor [candidate division KSB1 bacterium]NIS27843.1 TonB-dependent receptor [candidate division KSB1 bacterium]NIT74725.1 TonB-dependent receptor [candidate division KSB1 bacterium]NIU28508.1 TonB-dependent receptor [candidate division KSB1 bacterium]